MNRFARNADSTDGENPIEFPRGKVILAARRNNGERKMEPRGAGFCGGGDSLTHYLQLK